MIDACNGGKGNDESVGAAEMPESPLLVRALSMRLSNTSGNSGPNHSLLGIILVIMGSFSFSCMFLFVKLLNGKANTFEVAFYRALVEIPIAIYLIREEGEGNKLEDFLGPPSARGWLLVRGGAGGAAVLCFFYAIQRLPLPDAVTLQFTTPPFAAAFAVWFAGERWGLLDMIGSVVCLLGVMLIANGTSDASVLQEEIDKELVQHYEYNSTGAIVVALLGAAFAGIAYTSVRMIGHDASANVMVLYYSCLGLPLTLVGCRCLMGYWEVWKGGSNLGSLDWFGMLLTGITAYAGQYMTNLGLQHESAATATLATCSQIVFTYFFELVFLREQINIWSVAGTILILGFMVIVGLAKMKEADENVHGIVAGETEELALMVSAEHHVKNYYSQEA